MTQEHFQEHTRELALTIAGGRVTAGRTRDIERHAARVVQGGRVQAAYHVGPIAPAELLARAAAATDTALPMPHALPADQRFEASLLPETPRIDALEERVREALAALPADFSWNGEARSTRLTQAVSNDAGTTCKVAYERTSFSLQFRHRGSANIFDGDLTGASLTGFPFLAAIEELLPYLRAHGREAALPAGRLPVLFPWPEVYLLQRLGQALQADLYHEGWGLPGGKLDEQPFAPEVGLDDLGLAPEHGVVAPFDGEGRVRPDARLPLVEGGRVVRLIADGRRAAQLGVPDTGNAVRRFAEGLSLDFHGLSLRPGRRSYRQLLAELPACVVSLMAIGGATSADGVFSSPLNLAYLVRHGEVVGRLPQLSVQLPVVEALNGRLVGIASDTLGGAMPCPALVAEADIFKL